MYMLRREKKLIFKGKQENEEVGKKKKEAGIKYQVDPEDSLASILDLLIAVP